MAVTKKDLKQAPQATPAAATYAIDSQEEEQQSKRKRQRRGEKLSLVSFTLPPQLLAESRRLAHYRQMTHSLLIQQIVESYIQEHREEIRTFDAVYEKLGKPLPNPTE